LSSSNVIIASKPFFSKKEISDFERLLLTNENATEHDASDFFIKHPTFLHLGQGGQIQREVVLCGSDGTYRVDFFKKSFGRKHWDLIELKRPTYPVVISQEGNHPRLSAVATAAISQTLDYRDRIISDPDVRKELAQKGIIVLRPKLLVILGQDPEGIDSDKFEVLLDRVRQQGPIDLLTYTEIHRFAVEYYEATGTIIIPSEQVAVPGNLEQSYLKSVDFGPNGTWKQSLEEVISGLWQEILSQPTETQAPKRVVDDSPSGSLVRLFIGNLPFRIEETELRSRFQEVGQVFDFFWPLDKETGRKKGFAFVDIEDTAVDLVLGKMNGAELLGRSLVVNRARPRTER
jgi:RNA recognition motif. (a.k.a. RRM, RBD, or RNP domain)/Domain of unknown function (DUF4263)